MSEEEGFTSVSDFIGHLIRDYSAKKEGRVPGIRMHTIEPSGSLIFNEPRSTTPPKK
jgi:hypothetical protein